MFPSKLPTSAVLDGQVPNRRLSDIFTDPRTHALILGVAWLIGLSFLLLVVGAGIVFIHDLSVDFSNFTIDVQN